MTRRAGAWRLLVQVIQGRKFFERQNPTCRAREDHGQPDPPPQITQVAARSSSSSVAYHQVLHHSLLASLALRPSRTISQSPASVMPCSYPMLGSPIATPA